MFKSILVPVDLSDPDHYRDAVAEASGLAKQSGGEIRLMTVIQSLSSMMAEYLPEDAQKQVIDEATKQLHAIAKETGMEERVTVVIRDGATHHEVLQEAVDSGCDLIVMGSHQPGFATYFLGSHATTIVRHAVCSVLVLRGKE